MKYTTQLTSLLLAVSLAACAAGTYSSHPASVQDPAQATAPINETCPISGKAVDASVTCDYEGMVVALCCMNCKPAFEADPAKYMAKYKTAAYVNETCPISGKAVDASVTCEYEGMVVALCCMNCKPAFEADPAKYMAKYKTATYVNETCPISGKMVDGSVTCEYEGKFVAVCCKKCKRTFEADPAKYAANLGK